MYSTILNVLADSDQKNFLDSFYELNKKYATNHSSIEQSYALLKEQFPNEKIVDFLYVVSLKQQPLFGIIQSYPNKSGLAYFSKKLTICNKELIEEIPFSNVFNCYPEFKGFRLSPNFDSLLDHHYLEAATCAPVAKTYKDTSWQKLNQEYKEYLDKKPRDLKAYIFFWKQLLESEENTGRVVQSLSKYVEANIGILKLVCESDREIYDKTKNCLLYNINRPFKEIYHRTILNLPYKESVKNLKKLIDIASYDGRYYRYNLLLARLYETKSFKRNYRKLNKKNNAALLQYELAFKGYKELLENEIIRMKYYGYSISAYYEAGNMAVGFDTFGGFCKLPPHRKYDNSVLKTFRRVWQMQFEELTSGIKHNGGNVSFDFNNFFTGLEKKYALLLGPSFKEIYQMKMEKVE